MTRAEAEELARQDFENGDRRTVPGNVEAHYEALLDELWLEEQQAKRAALRRKGIVVPWWERL